MASNAEQWAAYYAKLEEHQKQQEQSEAARRQGMLSQQRGALSPHWRHRQEAGGREIQTVRSLLSREEGEAGVARTGVRAMQAHVMVRLVKLAGVVPYGLQRLKIRLGITTEVGDALADCGNDRVM